MKPVAVITGAAGGMGVAVARLLGHAHRLVLNDVDGVRLGATLSDLTDEGMDASAVAGDLSDAEIAASLGATARDAGPLRAIVNAAGLSPVQADWMAIVRANAIAPARLLATLEPLLQSGTVCVMIASVAGHLGPYDGEAENLLDHPLQEGLADRIEQRLKHLASADGGTMQGHAYSLTKRAVIRLCEQRAPDWGSKGARIVSLSPGMIWTPMGRREAESGLRAQALVDATPAGRWGTPMDIAKTVDFLLSDAASFISGSDIRVDGGAVAAMRGTRF